MNVNTLDENPIFEINGKTQVNFENHGNNQALFMWTQEYKTDELAKKKISVLIKDNIAEVITSKEAEEILENSSAEEALKIMADKFFSLNIITQCTDPLCPKKMARFKNNR